MPPTPPFFDFHTHRLSTPPGSGIVCLPQSAILGSEAFDFHPAGLYAAGIHPWWTAQATFSLEQHLSALRNLIEREPRIVQIGECGFDKLRGAPIDEQRTIFHAQVALSEEYKLPMTLHVVRSFDLLLQSHRQLRPRQQWTVHGFRGKPALAEQLLSAGLHLSFGNQYNPASFAITPPECRHRETDAYD